MPPEVQKGESLSKFVSKYMGSEEAREHFPKQKQRAAVAYSEYKQSKKKSRKK